MRSQVQAKLLASLFLCLALAGCSFLAPVLLVMDMAGVDDKANIKYKFEKDAKRVAVVVHLSKQPQTDIGHFDRDVANLLAMKIANYTNKKPEVVISSKVQKWMDEHQDWKTPDDIGRGVNADYVVFVEIRRLGFYEKEGWTQFYKGTCEATVSVHRVGHESEETVLPFEPTSCAIRFPAGMKPLTDSDLSLPDFRNLFIRHTAERLSWIFVPHATQLEYGDDK
ncbi:MAG: hypothetical protein QM703_17100 [Gemmatales bacterium]